MLFNGTDDTLAFDACDSCLKIVQEAQDKSGRWRPVEYNPRSWCGNSYHRAFLPARHCWQFPAPRYRGPEETKLRFVMTLSDGSHLVSNEFDGSVHPKQFTDKQGHVATNIMDSYDE